MPEQGHADRGRLDLPKRRPMRGYVVAALVVLVLASVSAAAGILLTRDRTTTCPSLLGLTLEEAAASTELNGLGLLVTGGEDGPDAIIVEQDPLPGTEMRRGAVVAVVLAPPAQPATVPDVVGVVLEEAETLLSSAGLLVGMVREDPEASAAPGSIVRQNPAAGRMTTAGATVDLWIAGASKAIVPDLIGLTETEAAAAAAAEGMALRLLGEVTDEVLPGLVFKQNPSAGERVSVDTVIVAIINASSAGIDDGVTGGSVVPPPPGIFVTLSRSYPFTVLYPTSLPAGLTLDLGPDNPGYRAGPGGTQGFEVVYTDPLRPDVTVNLLEGDWFDPGLDHSTTVDVRDHAAALGSAADRLVVVWSEEGVRYAVSALGLDETELLAIADGLAAVTPK